MMERSKRLKPDQLLLLAAIKEKRLRPSWLKKHAKKKRLLRENRACDLHDWVTAGICKNECHGVPPK